jgi:hypothetical protein
MKSPFGADNSNLPIAAFSNATRPRELDRAFRGLGASCEQKHLVQSFRRKPRQQFDKFGALFAWENIIVQEAAVDLVDDRLAHFGRAMAAIGH